MFGSVGIEYQSVILWKISCTITLKMGLNVAELLLGTMIMIKIKIKIVLTCLMVRLEFLLKGALFLCINLYQVFFHLIYSSKCLQVY